MKVTVVNRELHRRLWGNGYRSIHEILCTVEISDACPVCGGVRGEPTMTRLCEDEEWYNVSIWRNPCGHLDKYEDVLKESQVEITE